MQQAKKYQRAVLLWVALIDSFLLVCQGNMYLFLLGYFLLVVAIVFAVDTREKIFSTRLDGETNG